ncbi:MAG: virulence RhuM family protein [Thioalkalivibrio sp.]|jgi:hypothetical protein|nr:virulence RhuM family protein [Thioalkalivibrio sp.]
MNVGQLILYRTEDGQAEIQLRAEGDTVWLTQSEMAELFDTTKQNVSLHVRNILKDGELHEAAVIKESLTTAADGKKYRVKWDALPMILAVGYRVRSPRGTPFRQWATAHLEEYLLKGFVMDDERLKEPGDWDYFDEVLARVRLAGSTWNASPMTDTTSSTPNDGGTRRWRLMRRICGSWRRGRKRRRKESRDAPAPWKIPC